MRTIISTIITGLVLAACTGSTAVKEGTTISEQPDWVQTLGRYDKGVGAVASAPFSDGGTQAQLDEASLAASFTLSQTIERLVEGSISTTSTRLRETGLGTGGELTTLQTQKTISNLIKQNLEMAILVKQWPDPVNKELWVWLILERDQLNQLKNNLIEEIVQKKLNESEEKHQKKLKILREELEKQFNK
jgi:transcriptional regulator of heat shock response